MNKSFLLLIPFLFLSCKEDKITEEELSEPYEMYGIINQNLSTANPELKKEIEYNLSLTNDSLSKKYHQETERYLSFLDSLESKIPINDFQDIFSNHTFPGADTKAYNQKTEAYLKNISDILPDKYMRNRASDILYTQQTFNAQGEPLEVFEYLYNDRPIIAILTHLNWKKNEILQLENEFIKSRKDKPTGNNI